MHFRYNYHTSQHFRGESGNFGRELLPPNSSEIYTGIVFGNSGKVKLFTHSKSEYLVVTRFIEV